MPWALLATLVLAACNSVDHLEIDPKEVVLHRKNDAQWVKCVGKNAANHVIPKTACTWKTSDEKIAVVDNNGKLAGRSSGATTVFAHYGKLEAEAMVRIEAVERVEVEPKSITFSVGDEPKEVAVKAFTWGDHPLSGRNPEFKTQNPDIAAIADGNKIFPGQPGQTHVTVYVDDLKYDLAVTVLPKGKGAPAKGGGDAKKKSGKKG
jgi:hypothetical protein